MWLRARWQPVALAVLALIVLALVVAQLVLPGIAENRVRDRVGRYGPVHAVHVHAVPAIALLWGDAQEITVSAGAMTIAASELADLEHQLGGVSTAELSTPSMDLGLSKVPPIDVPLGGVLLHKHGDALNARASVSAAAVRDVLPAGLTVTGLQASDGQPELTVAGELVGVSVSGNALISAKEGKIVVEPVGLPIAGFASLTLFSDPYIYVESVSAAQQAEGLAVSIRARQVN